MSRSPDAAARGRAHAPRRAYARTVAGVALVALGLVALPRIGVRELPPLLYPSISVALHLGEGTDVADVALRYLPSLESAVRELGDLRGMKGQVAPTGAWFEVGFTPGTDPVVKAGKLSALLARLRGKLPEGSSVVVAPRSEALDAEMTVALVGRDASGCAPSVVQALEALQAVREVEVAGSSTEELRVELSREEGVGAEAVRSALLGRLGPAALGTARLGGRELPVVAGAPRGIARDPGLLRIPVRGVLRTLGSFARVGTSQADPEERTRVDGEPAVLLEVRRSSEASPAELDSLLRSEAPRIEAALGGRARLLVLESEGAPIRRMLEGASRALAVALLLLALGAFRLGGAGAAVQAAWGAAVVAGAVLNAAWLGGFSIDLVTTPAMLLGLFAGVGVLATTVVGRGSLLAAAAAAMAAALVPVAVALGTGPLAAFLATPARAFGVSAAAACAAALLASPATSTAAPRGSGAVRALLRDPVTVVLFGISLPYLALVYFAPWLLPAPASLGRHGADLSIRLGLPEGTTLAHAEQIGRTAESRLAGLSGVTRVVTTSGASGVVVGLTLDDAELSAERRARIAFRAEWRLRWRGAAVEVDEGSGAPGASLDLSGDMEERPFSPDDASTYRVILRSEEPAALERGYEALHARLPQLRPEWQRGIRRTLLEPRGSSSASRVRQIAAAVEARTEPPRGFVLPGPSRRRLVVLDADRPRSEEELPQLRRLLEEPVSVGGQLALLGAELSVADERLVPSMMRISGRFVLPCRATFERPTVAAQRQDRAKLHRSLELVRLPPGVDLERPDVSGWSTRVERLRLLALALLFPALLATLAALLASSLPKAALVSLPILAGLGAVAPLLAWHRTALDELSLVTLAAGLSFVGAPLAALAGRRSLRGAVAPALENAPAMLLGGLAVLGGTMAAFLTPGAGRDAWRLPLLVGGLAGAVALATAPPLLSAGLLAARPLVRDARIARAVRRRPAAWHAGGAPSFEARSLTKRYGADVWAVRDVSFALGPGIVGLLGPNGAGKTTLLRLLVGLLEPTRGKVFLNGVAVGSDNLPELRRLVGFLPQEFNAYPGFTAEQFLGYWALEKGMREPDLRAASVAEVLALVGLEGDSRRRVRDFSGGMRQRIGIAQALLGAPPVLIVDEPTTGLDIAARQRFREVLLRVARERIVILSTHLAGDVEATAGRLLLVHRGRLCFDGTPAELIARARGLVCEDVVSDRDVRAFGRRHRVTARVRVLEGIRVRAVASIAEPPPGRIVEPTLEEAYLAEIDRIDRALGLARKETLSFLG